MNKLQTTKQIEKTLEQLKKERKTIAFTNGCFDILHAGHVSYLEKAKNFADILIVGLNSDNSIKRLKGAKRPINSERDRAIILCGLSCVDYVVIFEEDTPIKLIKTIKPDILIKGADWKEKAVAGCDFIKSYGGKCQFIDLLDNHSTTNIIEKILNEYCRNI